MTTEVPRSRLRDANDAPIRVERAYVLHWITAQRRLEDNFALDRSVELARELGKPLVVLEALRVGYPYASDRLQRFILDGMADTVEGALGTSARWHAYVERRPGEGSGLLEALARDAAVVVTDDTPTFFLPRMVEAAARKLDVRMIAVDGNGLVPLRLPTPVHATAYSFRRELQKLLPPQLEAFPSPRPLERLRADLVASIDPDVEKRWPSVDAETLRDPALLASLPIDHTVPSVRDRSGGSRAGLLRLRAFVEGRLGRYPERNHPDADVASGLSPYLHFGHVGAHRIFREVVGADFDPARLSPNGGKREGYYRLDAAREAFLEQLVTWRELGFHVAHHRPDFAAYGSLPEWARKTLDEHRADPRPVLYDLATLARAATHDPLWNAAQRELLETGTIHNYMRMLWGKKILEWSASPEEAFRVLVELNDRYALDGRDPNSYSGIGWVLGRFDRPFPPRRPIFGLIRYMSSASARKKLDLGGYLERFGDQPALIAE